MYLNRTFLTDSLWLFARGTSHTGLLNLPGSLMTLVRSLGAVLVAAQGCWAQSWVSPVFKSSIVNDPLKLGKVPPLAPLIIYGAGVLGRSVAKQWLTAQTDQPGKVVGITKTTDNHAPLIALGVTPYMNNDIDIETIYGHHVLFCAPPPRNPDPEVARSDYLAEIRKSLIMWDRGNVASRFVFTSSAGVYAEDGGATVDESSATSASARAQLLLDAEALVLESKGIVVRLAGLYTDEKGAHAAFLSNDPSPFTQNELAKRPDGLINQIHYEDAASAAIVAGLRGVPGEIYLAADDQPLTREAICTEARRTERFKNQAAPQFGDKGGTGKVCDASKLRALGWKPRFASFSACMDYQALIMKAVDEIDKDKRRLAADWSDWFGPGGGRESVARRLAQEEAEVDGWLQSWRDGLECWYIGLPMPNQAQLGSCMGALALHVGSRLETVLGRTPTQMAAASEPGCEWLGQHAPHWESLPDFPEGVPSQFEALPPIPALLPKVLPSWSHLNQVVLLEQNGMDDAEVMAFSDYARQATLHSADYSAGATGDQAVSGNAPLASGGGTEPNASSQVITSAVAFAAAFGISMAVFSAAVIRRRRRNQRLAQPQTPGTTPGSSMHARELRVHQVQSLELQSK